MAGEKEKPEGWNLDPIEAFIALLFLLAIIASVVPAVISFFTSGELSFYGFKLSRVFNFFRSNAQFFKTLGFVVAGISAIGTFIFTKKADAVWREEKAKIFPKDMATVSLDIKPTESEQMPRWGKIIKLSESQNSSDWRLSVIEADVMLSELLEKLQLPGETTGEKLKAVEKSDFTTIEYAWEAHKARNMITHEGSDYLINPREIRHIISLYESVFKEFNLI